MVTPIVLSFINGDVFFSLICLIFFTPLYYSVNPTKQWGWATAGIMIALASAWAGLVDIPVAAARIYGKRKQWTNWYDFLGKFSTFRKARKFCSGTSFTDKKDYQKFISELEKSNSDVKGLFLPLHPDKEYKDKGWKGWPHFLGKTK